jgi:ABC-type bacteriocin/lantibiotic exporter with double-glycine peptidase domain
MRPWPVRMFNTPSTMVTGWRPHCPARGLIGEGEVFRNLPLSVAAGEFVAVTGRSGSGKTTRLRLLLLCMETPAVGGIFFDGHDLRSVDARLLRQQIGTVLQHGCVPPGSILEAVRGLSDATEEEVWQALRAAMLAEDVAAMLMGLRTLLTNASRTLSGGQVQRLLIARALAQRPSILLLDEATSALDPATAAAALSRLPATCIVIAHRLPPSATPTASCMWRMGTSPRPAASMIW